MAVVVGDTAVDGLHQPGELNQTLRSVRVVAGSRGLDMRIEPGRQATRTQIPARLLDHMPDSTPY